MIKTKIALGLAALVLSSSVFAQKDAMVRVTNRSSYDVQYLYTSPAGSASYGNQNLLGGRVLPSGYNRRVDFNVDDAGNKCVQDIMAKTVDGKVWRKRFNVCEENEWTLYD